MLTPSGRFQPDRKICFSMSDFHPGTVSTLRLHWLSYMLTTSISGIQLGASPPCKSRSLGLSTAVLILLIIRLTGLLSFMLSDEMTTGSVTASDAEKRAYGARSHSWNLEQRRFREAFPDVRPALYASWTVTD